ncbi:hypothetical protein Golax_010846 [Gossypium laxum]|uniref:Large ribosomal subunit protein uL15/eL18 domain-containing protein n=2 Tax=Gossypium TaxID=3633 RepID=A0A7J8X607_GOSAI|nr:hypothetical protein [Gossypium aridum]MBA0711691.1 hypothetical protein [Gossypium laxum]
MEITIQFYLLNRFSHAKTERIILGDGELNVKLNLKARAFSASAKEKLEAVGCSLTVLPGRKKWAKPSVAKNLAQSEEYFAKKRAASSSDYISA